MAWYHIPGHEQDVVVSSRVRFARNLAHVPFVSKMDAPTALQLIQKVGAVLENGGFTPTNFQDISRTAAYALVEQHYASPAFVKVSLPHTLYVNQPCHLSVMLCEEDHIRLQCIQPGLSLEVAYEGACKIEQMLDDALDLAFDDTLGYLTHCPTNVGSGMRASVMLFLPLLNHTGRMAGLSTALAQMGISVRGTFGEGSRAVGCLYQLSNRMTLGVSQEETLATLAHIAERVIDSERQLRVSIRGQAYDRLRDRVMRSLGALRYACILSVGEMMELWTDVRLGIAMGLVDEVKMPTLTSLLVEAMPAMLTLNAKTPPADDHERDVIRANYVREKLKALA